jgi:GTP-binding protein EngB required for normal cell division
MRLTRNMRLLLALSVVLTLLGIAGAAVGLAGSLAEVWERLRTGPAPIFYGLLLFLAAVSAIGGWLIWRLLFPGRRRRPERSKAGIPASREALEQRIADGRAEGIDVSAAERELLELARRREAGELFLCVFGQISTGKSSLIRELVPGAAVETGVIGGTTRDIAHYRWRTPGGDALVIADVPGTAAPGSEAETAAMAEAVRAHVVVYTCDSDLSREQYEELVALAALDKPIVLALNKGDRYSAEEIGLLEQRLSKRLREAGAEESAVVVVSARSGSDGVADLAAEVQRMVERSPDALEALRDAAVFSVVATQLDAAAAERRRQRSEELVRGYTRKAVVGAVAAVSPGTDILIQGYLGTALVKEMCALYDVPARDIDIDRLLRLSQGYVGRTLPILLAVAGNGLKAFPGVGTIAGGLTHAVAYGLIFDALGRGLAQALDDGGELRPAAAARKFRENLGEDLRARTIRMAKLVLEEKDTSRDQ